MTQNIFRWEIFLQTKFRLLVTKYFITESQFFCSVFCFGDIGFSLFFNKVHSVSLIIYHSTSLYNSMLLHL